MQIQAHVNISRKNAKRMFCVEKSRNFYDISEFRLPRSSYSRSTTPGFTLGFFFFYQKSVTKVLAAITILPSAISLNQKQDSRQVRQKTGVTLKGRRGRSTLGLLLHAA